MVITRQSTGNLPVAKRKYLPDDFSGEDDRSEEEAEMYPEKHTRKTRCTTSKWSRERSNDNSKTLNEEPTTENDSVDAPDNNSKTVKPGRMNSLITGPLSKGVLAPVDVASVSSKKKIRVRKSDLGKLSRMMELSVEVFCEIASYLMPLDLLRLSRTSRTLRGFFLSRSSRAIWTASIMAIGMPPCPSDMSEPQYANLYLEKECHACGYARVEMRMDFSRIRLCKGCIDVNFVQGKEIVKENFNPKVGQMYEIFTLLPCKTMRRIDTWTRLTVTPGIEDHYFLRYDFLEVVKAYLETEPDSDERKAFVEKRHQLIREMGRNFKKIEEWQWKRSFDRQESEFQSCSRRQAQIREKLCSLGYSHDDIDSLSLAGGGIGDDWCRIVDQPRELTDRIWKSIRPKLEELFRKKKQFDFDRGITDSELTWTT
ncbi:hypothetical protein ACEPAG_3007 [Sanghuangporus baumii]